MDQKQYKCFRYKIDCVAYFIFRATAKLVQIRLSLPKLPQIANRPCLQA